LTYPSKDSDSPGLTRRGSLGSSARAAFEKARMDRKPKELHIPINISKREDDDTTNNNTPTINNIANSNIQTNTFERKKIALNLGDLPSPPNIPNNNLIKTDSGRLDSGRIDSSRVDSGRYEQLSSSNPALTKNKSQLIMTPRKGAKVKDDKKFGIVKKKGI
jgi:hypothetical protein